MKEYAVPLILTSPAMQGGRVKDAQYLLSGHSRFEGLATYKDGNLDGIYGPATAQATKSAKFWLGFPTASIDAVFGQRLYEYLRPNDWRPLPAAYQQRRAERLRAATKKTPGLLAFELAETQIGTEESPFGSNRQKYGEWFGFNGVPWCAIFESWCMYHAGWKKYHYAACSQIVGDARAGRNGLKVVKTPRCGDVAVYDLHGDPYAHTAFFEKDLGGGQFGDLGGNTGPTNISNGGAVMRGVRTYSSVTAFVRVG